MKIEKRGYHAVFVIIIFSFGVKLFWQDYLEI